MAAPILDHMTALADQTRCRMLLLLEKHELTVSELCSVLQMPQSTVSRHLKTLGDDRWVTSRRDGTSRFYTMPVDDLDAGAAKLWPLIREQVRSTRGASNVRLAKVTGRWPHRHTPGSIRPLVTSGGPLASSLTAGTSA